MNELKNLLIAFNNDEDGAGATEYIILLILIACVVIGIVKVFGTTVADKFSAANDSVNNEVTF